jgi:hypothetical protein
MIQLRTQKTDKTISKMERCSINRHLGRKIVAVAERKAKDRSNDNLRLNNSLWQICARLSRKVASPS